jgi:hypothetical protein
MRSGTPVGTIGAMSKSGRVLGAVLIGALAACGGASVNQARDELVAIGDRQRADDPAQALANYLAAEKLQPSDEARRRIEELAREIADAEIAAARQEAAQGDVAGGFERLLRVRAGLGDWNAGDHAALDAAIVELARPAFEAERARLTEHNAIAVVRALRRIAHEARDESIQKQTYALVGQVRDYFLARAAEAAGVPLAADLHLRVAQSLGADLPDDAVRLLNSVEEQLLLPIRVTGGGGGCDDVLQELRNVVERGNDVARELTLVAELSAQCSAEVGSFENNVGGVVVPFEALVLRVVGSVTLRFAGETARFDVDRIGSSSEVQSLDYARARARDEVANQLAATLREAREAARTGLLDRMRPALASSQWQERDAAAVVMWGIAQDGDAFRALNAAYGIDSLVLATLYPDDGGRATLPAAFTPSPPDLPEPQGGEAVARLERQRDRYGSSDPIEAESRPHDYWRPGLGVAYVVEQSPLVGAGRAHGVRLEANLTPINLFVELARDELGGDIDGWEVGYAPRLPISEWMILTTGFIGGRLTGDGERHGSFAVPLVFHVPRKYLVYGAGIELNLLQLGGTGSPPDTQRFTPMFLAVEAPLPLGPRLYLRFEGAYYLGAGDPWTAGVWLGARKVLADKL